MIRTFLSRAAQFLLIISIFFAGSFMLMEETTEKTERAESEQEAIQSIWDASKSIRLIEYNSSSTAVNRHLERKGLFLYENFQSSDYNIQFIYHTSFLDFS